MRQGATRISERRALWRRAFFPRAHGKKDIPLMTPELAQIYVSSGPKTLTRDLNELVTLGLLRFDGAVYDVDINTLIQLLPLTVPQRDLAEGQLIRLNPSGSRKYGERLFVLWKKGWKQRNTHRSGWRKFWLGLVDILTPRLTDGA